MNKKNCIIILAIIIMISGFYLCSRIFVKIPFNEPTTIIKYNGNTVQTSIGDHNWLQKKGGSSYETGGEYTIGLNTPEFSAKSGDKIYILIPKKPLSVRIDQIIDNNYTHKEFKPSKMENEYIFNLPTKKGKYIFKVFATWDTDKHNTATIFRVNIQ